MSQLAVKTRRPVISLTEAKTVQNNAAKAVDRGKTIAGAMETIMDQKFIEAHVGEWFFVDYKSAPVPPQHKNYQDYFIDRKNKCLVTLEEFEAKSWKGNYENLAWHQKLRVPWGTERSVNQKQPLILAIGYAYYGRGLALTGEYLFGSDLPSKVVQCEVSNVTSKKRITKVLRTGKD